MDDVLKPEVESADDATPSVIWNSIHLSTSFVSSVSLVLLHKYMFNNLNFTAGTLLMALNYGFCIIILGCITYSGTRTGHKSFQYVYLPVSQALRISFPGALSILFGSLSLRYNSVGFFQISKIMTVPFQIVLEIVLYSKYPTANTLSAILVVLLGVSLVTIHDIEVNFVGTIFAILTSLTTALSVINLIKDKGVTYDRISTLFLDFDLFLLDDDSTSLHF
jgi:solute carrier family 35 protein E3